MGSNPTLSANLVPGSFCVCAASYNRMFLDRRLNDREDHTTSQIKKPELLGAGCGHIVTDCGSLFFFDPDDLVLTRRDFVFIDPPITLAVGLKPASATRSMLASRIARIVLAIIGGSRRSIWRAGRRVRIILAPSSTIGRIRSLASVLTSDTIFNGAGFRGTNIKAGIHRFFTSRLFRTSLSGILRICPAHITTGCLEGGFEVLVCKGHR